MSNVANFERLGLSIESAFEPCTNLAAMQVVLRECFDDAQQRSSDAQAAMRMALSCYYSGNFSTGFEHGYVRRVLLASRSDRTALPRPAKTPAPSPAKEMQ